MRRGRHAADDGSLTRSVGAHTGRGLALVAVAFLIGLFLLQRVDEPAPGEQVETTSSEETTTTTTVVSQVTTSTAALRQPKDVRVLTANGTSVKGAGGRIKDRVLAAGYNALAATDTKTAASASAVYFTAGFEREAAALAQTLGLQPAAVQAMPNPVPVADLKAANILVVVGPDLANAGTSGTSGGSGGSSSTSTTARSNTTTTARAATTTSTTR